MKTQTSQLSLLEAEQVTGGTTNRDGPPIPEIESSASISGKPSTNMFVTLSGRETGGRFIIMN